MGGPATTGTSYASTTNISLPFPFVFFTGSLHSDIVHYIVKVLSEVRVPRSKEPFKWANKLTFSCRKQTGLFKFIMIKCLRQCFSLLGNTFIKGLKGSPCTTVQKELLSKRIR